jgi:hypothetical protein
MHFYRCNSVFGMSKLRKSARGEECTIQIHPYCNMNPETTVLCHAPSEHKGTSLKSPDWWAAYGCSTCHDIVDSRMRVDIPPDEIYRCFMRGVFRTIQKQIEKGLIDVKS